jgi:cytochrome c-type biogenesis protein CcmH
MRRLIVPLLLVAVWSGSWLPAPGSWLEDDNQKPGTWNRDLRFATPRVYADDLDDQTRNIAKRLQCPVCEGQAVADSPSELAGQMRAVIRRKLDQGESETEIVAYFVERYGDAILIEPPRRGFGLAVWLAPLVILIVGAGLLALVLRSWLGGRPRDDGRTTNDQSDVPAVVGPPSVVIDPYTERARDELEGIRREL